MSVTSFHLVIQGKVSEIVKQVELPVRSLYRWILKYLKLSSASCYNYIGHFDCICDDDETSNDSPYVETSKYIYASNGLRTPDQVNTDGQKNHIYIDYFRLNVDGKCRLNKIV